MTLKRSYTLPTLENFKSIHSLPFYTSIIVDEIYETVLKEQGFNKYGEPKRSCKNPEMTVEELEKLAYEKYITDNWEIDEDEDEDF